MPICNPTTWSDGPKGTGRLNAARLVAKSIALGLVVAALPAQSAGLRPFDAVYSGRISIAKVEVESRLRESETPGVYVYERSSEPRGLARMIRRDGVRECALFEFRLAGARSLRYDYRDGDGGGKSTSIRFDWDAGSAASTYKGETVTLALDDKPIDRLFEEVVLSTHIDSAPDSLRLAVIERNEQHEVVYTKRGTERVKTKSGTYDTVHYSRRRGESSRTTEIWFAPELGGLPVRIERFKEGKSQGSLSLKRFAWADDQARGSVTPVCP